MSKRNKIRELQGLEIESMASEGKCVAHHNEMVIFVDKVAPGDVADVRVTRKKKNFLEATPTKIISHSNLRTTPFCDHFGTCGGCKWQHIQYDTQLKFKRQQVIDNLERIAKVELPEISSILASEKTERYRNKLEFTFTNRRWLTNEEIATEDVIERKGLGFHLPGRFDKILDIQNCHLQDMISDKIRMSVKEFCLENNLTFYDLNERHGLLRNLIIRISSQNELMVIVQFGEDDPENVNKVMDYLKVTFPEITSLMYVVNMKGNETFHDLEVFRFHGEEFIREKMEDLTFRIGPKSFFQTNTYQAIRLYEYTRAFASLTGDEVVYDLYTGTGTIANFVARNARKVIGIEYVPEAIEDAKINSQINNILNTEFFAGDMKDILTNEFIDIHGRPDVIITDPPRAGMHKDVVDTILNIAPAKIVYVSCNPATQARDIAILDQMYQVSKVLPVDMFPHTYHVECVVLLELRK